MRGISGLQELRKLLNKIGCDGNSGSLAVCEFDGSFKHEFKRSALFNCKIGSDNGTILNAVSGL